MNCYSRRVIRKGRHVGMLVYGLEQCSQSRRHIGRIDIRASHPFASELATASAIADGTIRLLDDAIADDHQGALFGQRDGDGAVSCIGTEADGIILALIEPSRCSIGTSEE